MREKPPLVELVPAPIVCCSGLARVEVIEGDAHYIFFQLQRDGTAADAPIVRAVNLHIVMSAMASAEGLVRSAIALDMSVSGYRRDG